MGLCRQLVGFLSLQGKCFEPVYDHIQKQRNKHETSVLAEGGGGRMREVKGETFFASFLPLFTEKGDVFSNSML